MRATNETMSYAFIANSLCPLEIIFQLLTKYHWELNITSEINGECNRVILKPFQRLSDINAIDYSNFWGARQFK